MRETTIRRHRPHPPLPGPIGAAASGVVVGITAVLLVVLAIRTCEATRDSASCGSFGMLMLVLIVGALMVLGRLVLTFVRVPRPTTVSVLGVLLAVVALLAGFVEQIFSAWMWPVVPLLGAAAFALAHLVLTAAAKPGADD